MFGSGELQTWASRDFSTEVAPPLLKEVKDEAMLEFPLTKPKDGDELLPSPEDSKNQMTSEIK